MIGDQRKLRTFVIAYLVVYGVSKNVVFRCQDYLGAAFRRLTRDDRSSVSLEKFGHKKSVRELLFHGYEIAFQLNHPRLSAGGPR